MEIAVTGLGCVTPCGVGVAATWEALLAGRSGVGRITKFRTEGFAVDIAAEVRDFDGPTAAEIKPKEARRIQTYVQYSLAAAQEAFRQSGLEASGFDAERAGAVVGTGIGALRGIETEVDLLRAKGPSRVNPLLVPSGTPEVSASEISRRYGLKGPSFSVSSACSSGGDAIISAARCIAMGELDVALVGGAEDAISELGVATFANLKALARPENDPPETVSRPFDRTRRGFVMGEGAGIVVLESKTHAERRGADVLAVLGGFGQTNDAFHKTAPDPTGAQAVRALRLAMETAGVAPEEIGYINAHGTSTPQNDVAETRAIQLALGDHARRVAISSTKSMTGHTIGAAGAVEAIVAIQTIRTGRIPPTINLREPDPECDLFYVPNEAIERDVRVAVSNSFGFGGHNSCLLFRSAR